MVGSMVSTGFAIKVVMMRGNIRSNKVRNAVSNTVKKQG